MAGFNPCMVVELSATPKGTSNKLISVSGRDLEQEQMLKLDLHVTNEATWDWRDTLRNAVKKRAELEETARAYEANAGRYIRPILLVQVERTGRDQRDDNRHTHAEQIKEHLIGVLGIRSEEVAIKSSDKDDLQEADDDDGLLSRNCQIRFIITKYALQEGWDCSFAYVLAILTNAGAQTALTQLVGRILRQPPMLARPMFGHWMKAMFTPISNSLLPCWNRLEPVLKMKGLATWRGEPALTAPTGMIQERRS